MNKYSIIQFKTLLGRSIWVYAALFYTLIVYLKISQSINEAIVIIASMLGIIFSIICISFVFSVSEKTERNFWGIMLLSCVIYLLGDLIRLYESSLSNPLPMESLSVVFYMINNTLIVLSVLYLAIKNKTKKANDTFLLDSGIVSISMITILWGFYIYPLLVQKGASFLLVVLSAWYPLTDIGLVIALFLLVQISHKVLFHIKWLAISLCLLILGDLLNIWLLSISVVGVLDLLDPFWVIGFLMMAYSGLSRVELNKLNQDFITIKQVKIGENIFLFFPYLTLICLLIIMVIDHNYFSIYVIGAVICNVLIIIKQHFILINNNQKLQQLSVLSLEISNRITNIESEKDILEQENLINITESITDALTGIYNKRYLETVVPELKKLIKNKKATFSVIMIDVDDFKAINDEFGHYIGDNVLKQIVGITKDFIREKETIIRFGGDEFLIFLPGTRLEYASALSERIRGSVETRLSSIDGIEINCTISIGVSEWSRFDQEIYKVIERSDQALYEAKTKGRNRCEKFPQ
jgi:diguanylate cyclase (GGDEF)-like protein